MPTKKPLTIVLRPRDRRRLEFTMRKHGLNLQTFLTRWTLAAVATLEGKRVRQ